MVTPQNFRGITKFVASKVVATGLPGGAEGGRPRRIDLERGKADHPRRRGRQQDLLTLTSSVSGMERRVVVDRGPGLALGVLVALAACSGPPERRGQVLELSPA